MTELLLKRTGIAGQHVPYPGTTQQLLATAAGTLHFTFDTPGNSKGVRDAGKVIALAVTGAKRSVAAPEVPTFRELGYEGFDDLHVANGLLAPKGTPQGIVEALNREMVRLNTSGAIRERWVSSSYDPGTISAEQYGAMIDRDARPSAHARCDRDPACGACVRRVGRRARLGDDRADPVLGARAHDRLDRAFERRRRAEEPERRNDGLEELAAAGEPAFERLVAEGHAERPRRDARWFPDHRALFTAAIT